MTNLFRQAKQLLDKKDAGGELTSEELQLINTAIIPLMVRNDGIFPEDMPIAEGLEALAKIVEEVDNDHRQSHQTQTEVSIHTSRRFFARTY